MVICRYFLRGTCRFGENCKYEHSYNDNSSSVLRKKPDIDPNIIIKSVSNDMDKAENGNQWPFSCYGPFQGKACFPGFEDKSFEEIRLGLYEAEKNGTMEQYKQQLTQILNETRMKMRSLLNPTQEATNVLKELFNSNSLENQNTNTFTNNSNSIFVNNSTNQPTIFGNTSALSQNMFATQPVATNTANNFTFTIPENKNIFGSVANNQISPGSIFSQNNKPGLPSNTNLFVGSTGKSIFSNTQQNSSTFQTNSPVNQNFNTNVASIFSNQHNNPSFAQQPATGANIFAQNTPFAQNYAPSTQPNPFKQNTINSFQQNPNDPYKQSTNDPFQQNTSDPFKQSTTDMFKQNVFQQTHQSPFSTSSFGQNSILHSQNQGTTNSLAEHTKSLFGSMQTTSFQTQMDNKRQDDATIYSKLEDLSEKEIKSFEASIFDFGKIPENPPTLQMC